MSAVIANALWLAIDADMNPAWQDDSEVASSRDAQEFYAVENFFCIVFSIELLMRFGAYYKKKFALKDGWFVFDAVLVVLMVMETWILPMVVHILNKTAQEETSLVDLSVLRLARLIRLSRIQRLLRAVPEVVTLLRGIVQALRSVFFTLVLFTLLLYAFGIIFRCQAMEFVVLRDKYFSTVGQSMWTLLNHGTFLDSIATVSNEIREHGNGALIGLLLLFILLSSFTVLNMLIGIICDVISKVKQQEEERTQVSFLQTELGDILDCYDKNRDESICSEEFQLLMQNPEAVLCLTKFGTDTQGFESVVDMIFQGDPEKRLPFNDLLQVILRLRGDHHSRVTDIIELRKYVGGIRTEMRLNQDMLSEKLESIACSVRSLTQAEPSVQQERKVLKVKVTWKGVTEEELHASSTIVSDFLRQYPKDSGRLVAKTVKGERIEKSLRLGDLLEISPDLHVHVELDHRWN